MSEKTKRGLVISFIFWPALHTSTRLSIQTEINKQAPCIGITVLRNDSPAIVTLAWPHNNAHYVI